MKARLRKTLACCALSLLASGAQGCLSVGQRENARPASGGPVRAGGEAIQGSARAEADAQKPSGDFQTFRGLIAAGMNVEMRLRRVGQSLEGAYFYLDKKTDIELRGQIDAAGNFTLRESSGGKHTGTFKGRWADDEETGRATLEGEWTRPDGTGRLPFLLTEYAVGFAGGRTLVAREIKGEDKRLRYKVEAEFPRIEGASDEGSSKFNRAAEEFARGKVGEFKRDVAEAAAEPRSSETGSDLNIAYEVGFADDELISVSFSVGSYYSGAAHPNNHTEVINFDLRRGRRLELADLFNPGAAYLQALSRYAVNSLKSQSRKAGSEPLLDDAQIEEGAGPDADNFKSWTITKRGLAITFDAYQVGPYAAGPQFVFIPYAELKNVIRPDGPVARFVR
ncbi:MAG TPA: DUF3298 domain-containing protein [Pyrinomonadaceae bacterium]|nr:DUF3298 domain-containing protein [Pyrinomonadaceae bacterium]